jgi:uncharacterized membrane protein YqjE
VLKDSVLKFLKLDSLIENLTGYVETRIELTKLELKEDIAKSLSKVLLFILMGAVFTLFVVLISVAVAHLIAKSIGAFGGFAVVAGFYLLLSLLLYGFRHVIGEKLQDQLVEIMKKKKE